MLFLAATHIFFFFQLTRLRVENSNVKGNEAIFLSVCLAEVIPDSLFLLPLKINVTNSVDCFFFMVFEQVVLEALKVTLAKVKIVVPLAFTILDKRVVVTTMVTRLVTKRVSKEELTSVASHEDYEERQRVVVVAV